MLLLFLDDPHQKILGLKESAKRLLNWGVEEQDEVAEWLIKNKPNDIAISRAKGSPNYFGRYICKAPRDLVGAYAIGDVDRTEALFTLLYPRTLKRGMDGAYNRERRLLSILLEIERQGVCVDLPRLRGDVDNYSQVAEEVDKWLMKKLKRPEGLNLNSRQELFTALQDIGAIDEEKAQRTPTGKFKTTAKALSTAVNDPQLVGIIQYRTQLGTCLNTFMKPWLSVAEASGGRIYTEWFQVKAPKGGGVGGTRTGRLSSTPNFQNIPNQFKKIFSTEAADNLPPCPIKNLPNLPCVRGYIAPEIGCALIDRDYSQQEPRILAHFDGEKLLEKYKADPWIDFHNAAQEELRKVGKDYPRKLVKNINLGILYGMGIGTMAAQNSMSYDAAKALKNSLLQLYPGIRKMYSDMRSRARLNMPIRTWGGREYYCEPAKIVDGECREFDYKMVNLLVQGSAADCMKEAIIRVYEAFEAASSGAWQILLNVHDQLTVQAPIKDVCTAMATLSHAMESIEFDVPMKSEGSISLTSWAALRPYDKRGEIL
jgi:DNA polymerase I-like protein with 3'-5' exonuclease and polymerase domains